MDEKNKKMIGLTILVIAVLMFFNQQSTTKKESPLPAYAAMEMASALALTGSGIAFSFTPLVILGLIVGGLFLITVVGGGIFVHNIGSSPWLIVALIVGVFILMRNLKKK